MSYEAALLVAAWLNAGQAAPSQTTASHCSDVAAGVGDSGILELCRGEEELRKADGMPQQQSIRTRHLRAAVQHLRTAGTIARDAQVKELALTSLVTAHDERHLNDRDTLENILKEIVALKPHELAPLLHLAKLQESRGAFDSAEETLLAARRGNPDSVEVLKLLAMFYARRVTALRADEIRRKYTTEPGSGQPDSDGVYHVGPGITPPTRMTPTDQPRYPPKALASGVTGEVVVEVVVDTRGNVTDAKVLRSVPLLDEEALRTVRTWRFKPATDVSGNPVPVRMTATVSFSGR